MKARDALGRSGDLGQLALGAIVVSPAMRALAAHLPGFRDRARHEPAAARGAVYVSTSSLVEKAIFLAKILCTDGARFRPRAGGADAADTVAASHGSGDDAPGDELLVAGDVLFASGLGRGTLSPALRARLASASAVVLNLEGTLGDDGRELAPIQTARGAAQLLRYALDAESPGWTSRLAATDVRAFLAELRSPVLSVANNHTLDEGEAGFDRTVALATALGATVVGDARREHGAQIVPVGRYKVGLVALSYGHNRPGSPPGLHLPFDRVPYALDRSRCEAIVADLAKRGATHVVGLLHWGYEHEHEPAPEQRRCVDVLFGAGFSAVVGHHPHLLQSSETRDGRAAFYSLGDFVGGDRTVWSRLGALASLRPAPSGRFVASLVPVAQSPYWTSQRTHLLGEAPTFERAAFASFFRWKQALPVEVHS